MIKLRIILLRNYIYYILLFIALIYFIFSTCIIKYETRIKDNLYTFRISKIEVKDYGIKLELRSSEKVLGVYYLKKYEIDKFLNKYSLNDKVLVTYTDIKLNNNTVENTFNYKKYLYNNRIYKYINISNIKLISKNKNVIYKFKSYLYKKSNKLINDPYMKSLILGDNSLMDTDVKESFKENGISHLFAVSGLHIAMFSKILLWFLKKLRISENKRYFINILFLLFYMFITSFTSSIVRAGIFTIFILINKIKYFYIKNLNILFFSLSIIIFINPFILYNIGFQFSFINTLFLILFSDKLNSNKKIISLFKTSLISFLASFPIVVNNFYQVNFLSIIYNIFYVPFISSIILPLIIITFICPIFDRVLNIFIIILERSSLFFKNVDIFKVIFSKMSIFHIVIYYVIVILLLKYNKKIYVVLLLIIFIVHFSIKPNFDYYLAFDVEQGDSALLYVGNTTNIIDTGGETSFSSNYSYSYAKNRIIPYLKSKGIRKINNLILTHGDYDHMGEAINLVNNFKVEKVIFNCGPYNNLEKELIKVLDKKKTEHYACIKELNIDNNKLYFLQTKEYDNENDNSNVIYTELDGYKFMFMGDASITTEKEILNKYNLTNIDVLKVGHHGSRTSSSKEFINEINPKYSIISVGKSNRYGHPNKEVLDNLTESKIYRTDEDGSIMLEIKNNKLKIETCAP